MMAYPDQLTLWRTDEQKAVNTWIDQSRKQLLIEFDDVEKQHNREVLYKVNLDELKKTIPNANVEIQLIEDEIVTKTVQDLTLNEVEKCIHLDTVQFVTWYDLSVFPNLRTLKAKVKGDLPNTLKNLKELTLSGSDLSSVPAAIKHLPDITFLSLHDNNISTFPTWLCNMTSLETLDLWQNPLQVPTGDDAEAVYNFLKTIESKWSNRSPKLFLSNSSNSEFYDWYCDKRREEDTGFDPTKVG